MLFWLWKQETHSRNVWGAYMLVREIMHACSIYTCPNIAYNPELSHICTLQMLFLNQRSLKIPKVADQFELCWTKIVRKVEGSCTLATQKSRQGMCICGVLGCCSQGSHFPRGSRERLPEAAEGTISNDALSNMRELILKEISDDSLKQHSHALQELTK